MKPRPHSSAARLPSPSLPPHHPQSPPSRAPRSALRVPRSPLPGVTRLLDVVHRLRAPGGCPWDREQTLRTLKPHLVEEAYELLEAIETGSVEHHREELGDVLLQVVLQACIREEEGRFTFDEVASRLADKLVHRHPHVFGDVKVSGTQEVLTNWDRLKAREKQERKSVLEGLPRHLPALLKAQRLQGRAARVGFDWSDVRDVLAKVDEELAETRHALEAGDADHFAEEVGDLLFAVVNLARFRHIHAEEALQKTNVKFTRRFRAIERRVRAEGRELKDCTLADLDAHWNAAKQTERRPNTVRRSPRLRRSRGKTANQRSLPV